MISTKFLRHPVVVFIACVIVLGVVALVIFVVVMDRFFDAVTRGNYGAVESSEKWPRPLKELTARAASDGIAIGEVKVHCLAHGLITDYVWRMPASAELFAVVSDVYELYPDDYPAEQFLLDDSEVPWWWKPKANSSPQFFLGRRSNIGEKGDKFVVLNDEVTGFIYVYYNDNW